MELVFILVTLGLSAFFSGSEIAFVTANRLRVEVFARRGGFVGPIVSRFLEDPSTVITTTLVGNNLSLVIYSTLIALYLEPPLGHFFETILGMGMGPAEVAVLVSQTILASAVVLIVGEIIPKSVIREISNRAVFALAIPLKVSYFVLLPLIKVSQWTATLLLKVVRADTATFSQFMRRDFELMIEESKRTGDLDLDEEESTLLSNVFAMSSIRVRESMVPRTNVVAVEESTDLESIRHTFVASGHSKIPVYRENIDRIVGIAFAYDLFKSPRTLSDIIRPATFVPETKMSKDLLQEFLASKTSIAIVIDEYGGTAGLVTSEDLLEELFGDIQDEFDTEDQVLRVVGEGAVIVSGRVDVDELEERGGVKLPEGDYETVAGYLLERLGTIPATRDSFELDGFRFTVLQATANRIDMIRINRQTDAASGS